MLIAGAASNAEAISPLATILSNFVARRTFYYHRLRIQSSRQISQLNMRRVEIEPIGPYVWLRHYGLWKWRLPLDKDKIIHLMQSKCPKWLRRALKRPAIAARPISASLHLR